MWTTIKKFRTKNFTLSVDAEPEDMEVDVDDDGETARKVERGLLVHFMVRVQIQHNSTGAVLGDDYLGGCIYENVEDFAKEHLGTRGQGSYLMDMIRESIKLARVSLEELQDIKLRRGVA